MTEKTPHPVSLHKAAVEPTTSSLDPDLYKYIPANAPDDVVVNIGRMDLMVGAQHATTDPQRIAVGDRRRGPYYLTLINTLPGLQRLKDVSDQRLKQVDKIRRQRNGEEMQDWEKAAHAKSKTQPDGPPPMLPSHAALTPLQRAAQGL